MTGPSKATPLMQTVLDQLQRLGAEPLETLTPEQARQQPSPADACAAAITAHGGDPAAESVGDVQDRHFAGPAGALPIRIYWPKNATVGDDGLPLVLYIHGGGWVIADLDVYDASPRAIANVAGAIVVSTHYRQGPEDRFPAAHDDTLAAYRWLVENAESLGGDPARIAVVGESAGGNMAAVIALAARDQGLPAPLHQVLVYPVADDSMATPSYAENANAKPLSKAAMEWFVKYAFNAPADAADPRIRLVARKDLQGLSPATIILAQIDPLRSEGQAYGRNLQQAGVDTVIEEYPGVTHEFFGMGAFLPEARQAQGLVGERLRAAFETGAADEMEAARPRPGRGAQGDRGIGLR